MTRNESYNNKYSLLKRNLSQLNQDRKFREMQRGSNNNTAAAAIMGH